MVSSACSSAVESSPELEFVPAQGETESPGPAWLESLSAIPFELANAAGPATRQGVIDKPSRGVALSASPSDSRAKRRDNGEPHRAQQTTSGGTRVQTTSGFHQRTLRLDRVGAVTRIFAATVGTKQGFGALGGTDGGRVPRRNRPRPRDVPAPIRHPGEARRASAIRQRSAQRAIRGPQRRPP